LLEKINSNEAEIVRQWLNGVYQKFTDLKA
jgi:hypothetical protein